MLKKSFECMMLLLLAGTLTACTSTVHQFQKVNIATLYERMSMYVMDSNEVLSNSGHPDAQQLIEIGNDLLEDTIKLNNLAKEEW